MDFVAAPLSILEILGSNLGM